MITCEHCGKKTGVGPVGESWICDDCKVAPNKDKEKDKEKPEDE